MLLFAILWACSTPAPDGPPTPSPEAEAQRSAQQAALKQHMQGHLAAVDAVREALVMGDLATAKEANRSFLDHKVAFDLPGDWLTHVAAMGDAAVGLDKASGIAGAAAQAAQVVAACGSCHQAVGAGVQLEPSVPAAGEPEHGPAEQRALQASWHALIASRDPGATPQAAADALTACATCHAKVPEGQ